MIEQAHEIIWKGVQRPDLNAKVLRDLEKDGVDKPDDLVFSIVLLTEDWDGPHVLVTGEDGKYVAEFHETTTWVSLAALEQEAGRG
ncbi:hypothetical protein [Paenirhodobacter enshiensis]|uniref:hypothetical protein n=1 Tax=Paenirhodobacter enshiensis TaxID=1105367 RepID=UPI0035AE7F02